DVAPRSDLGTAPGAEGELGRRRASTILAGSLLLDGRVAFLGRVRRHALTDPKADGERLVAPFLRVDPSQHLHRADQRGGSLELLQGEQTQGVSHDHGQTASRVVTTDSPL